MLTRISLVLLLLTGVAAMAAEPETPLVDVFLGKVSPLKLALKELTPEWRKLSLAGNFDPMQRFFTVMMAREAGGGAQAEVYYTKGDTVVLNGELYLLAYAPVRPTMPAFDQNEGPPQMPKTEPLKPDTVLVMSLLCLRTAGSFTDITPFNLEAEVATSQGKALKDANVESMSRLRQIATAIQMYVQDNKSTYPPMQSAEALKKAIINYVGSSDILLQPQTKEPYKPNPAMSGKKEADVKNPTEIIVVFEGTPAADGTRGVGYADGHAARVQEKDWPAIKAKSGIQ